MALPVSVRLKSLDDVWETLGVDRFSGIVPEQVRPAADQLGPSTLSFQIQRDTGLIHPDLTAWTPCEVEVGGKTVWDGRVKSTPAQKGQQSMITVNGLGYSSHLDDAARERYYVHQNITSWQDARSNAFIDLTVLTSGPQITSEGTGQLALVMPAGTAIPNGTWAAICLDLGLETLAASAFMDFTIINAGSGGGNLYWYIRNTSSSNGAAGAPNDAPGSGTAISNGAFASQGGIFPTPSRYVYVLLYCPTGFTPALDISMAISRILVSCNTRQWVSDGAGAGAFGGQGQSDLRASDVILDKVNRVCPLITAAPSSPAYQDEVLADTPLSYWRFSGANPSNVLQYQVTNGDPRTIDRGSLNNPLVSLGAASEWPGLLDADADTAMALSGASTNFAFAATNPGYGMGAFGMTVEAIIEPAALPSSGAWDICRREGQWALQVSSTGQLGFFVGTGGGSFNLAGISAAGAIVANRRYHVLGMYSPDGRIFLLVNGAAPGGTDTGSGSGTMTVNTNPVYIGCAAGTSEFFDGVIDEVSLYNYVLSPSQQAHHYQTAVARQAGGIQRTQFKIPHYAPSGSQTARTDVTAVNSLHNWRVKIPVGANMLFHPQPTQVMLRVNEDVDFSDAGANDGTIVYNECIVEGADATGQPVRVIMHAADVFTGGPSTAIGVGQISDPTFASSTAGAAADDGGSTPVLDAAEIYSGAHSLKLVGPHLGNHAGVDIPVNGAFLYGLAYTATAAVFSASANYAMVTLGIPGVDSNANPNWIPIPQNQWCLLQVTWVPSSVYPSGVAIGVDTAFIRPFGNPLIVTSITSWVDEVRIFRALPTICDRQGFTRTKVLQANSSIDVPTGEALAVAYLESSLTTPFKGSFVAAKADDVLLSPGDTPVHQSELLLWTDELVRIPVVNPDTGDLGRDGKIFTVAYDPDGETATVAVDDDRNNLAALMARMAILHTAAGA